MADPAFDLATALPCCLNAFLAGVVHGTLTKAQLEDERRDAEDALLHHCAYEVVQAAAKLPSHDELVEQRRRRTLESAQHHASAAAEDWCQRGEAS